MKRNSVETQEQCNVSTLRVVPFLWGREGQQLIKGKGVRGTSQVALKDCDFIWNH